MKKKNSIKLNRAGVAVILLGMAIGTGCNAPEQRKEAEPEPRTDRTSATQPAPTAHNEAAPRHLEPKTERHPPDAEAPASTQRATPPATAPATTRPTSAPSPESRPAPESADKLPPYVDRIIALDASHPHWLKASTRSPNTVLLDAHNLKRIRITRAALPFALRADQSVSIQVDGQGIEWLAQRDTIELERSAAGVWSVRKP